MYLRKCQRRLGKGALIYSRGGSVRHLPHIYRVQGVIYAATLRRSFCGNIFIVWTKRTFPRAPVGWHGRLRQGKCEIYATIRVSLSISSCLIFLNARKGVPKKNAIVRSFLCPTFGSVPTACRLKAQRRDPSYLSLLPPASASYVPSLF